MRRFCVFWNSYITVFSWPGCTSMKRSAGLKSHRPPRTLESNSTLIVRVMSTCVLSGTRTFLAPLAPPGTWSSESARMLMPVISQIARYIGTSA
ncbi:hypothetical protein D9M69_657010 [compost metagenome]